MGDLDDFELDRTPEGGEPRPPYRPDREGPRRRGLLFPVVLAAVAVLAVGVLAVLYFLLRQPAKEQGALPPLPVPTALATPRPPAVALPSLDGSDAFVRQLAASLSTHPALARWLAQNGLVRMVVAVVANVAEGVTPRPHLEFLAPKERFRATGSRRRLVPDPKGFAGYDAVADAIAALDAAAVATAYRTLEPLFEEAYRELGHPEGGFLSAVDRASAALLAAPVPGADVALVPHATGFRYTDPRLEGLSGAQKQLLRMGPRNVRLVQGKLRELRGALGLPGSGAREHPAAP